MAMQQPPTAYASQQPALSQQASQHGQVGWNGQQHAFGSLSWQSGGVPVPQQLGPSQLQPPQVAPAWSQGHSPGAQPWSHAPQQQWSQPGTPQQQSWPPQAWSQQPAALNSQQSLHCGSQGSGGQWTPPAQPGGAWTPAPYGQQLPVGCVASPQLHSQQGAPGPQEPWQHLQHCAPGSQAAWQSAPPFSSQPPLGQPAQTAAASSGSIVCSQSLAPVQLRGASPASLASQGADPLASPPPATIAPQQQLQRPDARPAGVQSPAPALASPAKRPRVSEDAPAGSVGDGGAEPAAAAGAFEAGMTANGQCSGAAASPAITQTGAEAAGATGAGAGTSALATPSKRARLPVHTSAAACEDAMPLVEGLPIGTASAGALASGQASGEGSLGPGNLQPAAQASGAEAVGGWPPAPAGSVDASPVKTAQSEVAAAASGRVDAGHQAETRQGSAAGKPRLRTKGQRLRARAVQTRDPPQACAARAGPTPQQAQVASDGAELGLHAGAALAPPTVSGQAANSGIAAGSGGGMQVAPQAAACVAAEPVASVAAQSSADKMPVKPGGKAGGGRERIVVDLCDDD